jgi:serine/threonine protein kinase, bacterial
LVDEPPVGGTTAEWPAPQFGHYLLLQLLGRGGFGEVYEALDTKKNRTVALKLLSPSLSANPAFRTRLSREAAPPDDSTSRMWYLSTTTEKSTASSI